MKNKKLTEEQKETANRYALKKWPDESVTVEDETNSECMRRRNNRPLSGAWCNRVAA